MLSAARSRIEAPVVVLLAAALLLGVPSAGAAPAGAGLPSLLGHGLDSIRLAGSHALGPLGARPITLTLVLAPRRAAELRALAAAPHAPLSRAAYQARFSPTRAQAAAVRAWARASGLRVLATGSGRMYVRVRGPANRAGDAFGVALRRLIAGGRTYYASSRAATLPAALAGRVNSVLGLSSLGALHTLVPLKLGPLVTGKSSYGPAELAALYDAPAAATGAGQHLAVIAQGNLTPTLVDLRSFEAHYSLPRIPVSLLNVGTPTSDTAGAVEWNLDTQYSSGLAPGASDLRIYVAPTLANDDILAAISAWVAEDRAPQVSASLGECELLASATGFTDALDAVLARAAAQGQTLFAASGDSGSFCPIGALGINGVPIGLPGPEYPASSPGAIGVGGTTVLTTSPLLELSWLAGGGGPSLVERTPAFQKSAGGTFLGLTRGVPDVALDADPKSGYQVMVSGRIQTIGGTSASAPAWQGIWARAQSAHGGRLGFAGPRLYGVPASAFHDIVLGVNGIGVATPGWDYTTGRGTPDIAKLIAAL